MAKHIWVTEVMTPINRVIILLIITNSEPNLVLSVPSLFILMFVCRRAPQHELAVPARKVKVMFVCLFCLFV